MIVELNLDDQYMRRMSALTGLKSTELTCEALSILKWAIDETLRGHYIVSAKRNGEVIARLKTQGLSAVKELVSD